VSGIDDLIQGAAQRYNLDPDIFRRQLVAESGLNPNARNPSGAAGIAQFMPATARGLGIDPMDPSQAIPAAALYMRQHLNRFGGDYTHALAAYNWGPGNVERNGVGNLPAETRNYVAKIMGGSGGGPPAPASPFPSAGPDAPAGTLMAAAAPAGPPLPLPPPPDQPNPLGAPTSLADAFTQAARRAQGFA
jgi:hypothetical protein